jgi:hypothetical protein
MSTISDYVRSMRIPKPSRPEGYQKCPLCYQHSGRINSKDCSVCQRYNVNWALSVIQCKVNNEVGFADEFPAGSEAAMTEQFYMQMQVRISSLTPSL